MISNIADNDNIDIGISPSNGHYHASNEYNMLA